MQSGDTPPTKLSPVIWGYSCTGPRPWQQDQVKVDAVCFAQKSPVYYHGCGECWLGMSLRIASSLWAAAGVCHPINAHVFHHACTHRPISTPAVQNEPVLSFAPGSEERRSVIQVMAVPRGNLVSKALYLTAWERGYIKGDSLAFHLHKYSQLG